MINKSEYINLVKDCFKKSGNLPPKSLESLQMSLADVDICIDCISNILCEEGFQKNDEPNAYGIQLEEVIDFLLNIRYLLVDSND